MKNLPPDNAEDQSEDEVNRARRKLLRTGTWLPPAIVASVAVGTRHAVAWSCSPGPCAPTFCMPNGSCWPDSPYCMPNGGCFPDRPCWPDNPDCWPNN